MGDNFRAWHETATTAQDSGLDLGLVGHRRPRQSRCGWQAAIYPACRLGFLFTAVAGFVRTGAAGLTAPAFRAVRAFLARATKASSRTRSISASENTPLTPEIAASFMPCLSPRR